MNNKFRREAKDLAQFYFIEYEIDPDMARSNLEERLEGKRNKVRYMVEDLIQYHSPEDLDD